MNSERNIIMKLRESKQLDEKTYTVGDTQYWKRSGKFYSWTATGGRKECSEEEYMKAIAGDTGKGSVQNTEPHHDQARKSDTKPNFTKDDLEKATYGADYRDDKALLKVDGQEYYKVGPGRWQRTSSSARGLPTYYSNSEMLDILSKATDVSMRDETRDRIVSTGADKDPNLGKTFKFKSGREATVITIDKLSRANRNEGTIGTVTIGGKEYDYYDLLWSNGSGFLVLKDNPKKETPKAVEPKKEEPASKKKGPTLYPITAGDLALAKYDSHSPDKRATMTVDGTTYSKVAPNTWEYYDGYTSIPKKITNDDVLDKLSKAKKVETKNIRVTTGKKESDYPVTKMTPKEVGEAHASYMQGDPARDIAYILADRNSKISQIVNKDIDRSTGEGSVDRLMKKQEYRDHMDRSIKSWKADIQKALDDALMSPTAPKNKFHTPEFLVNCKDYINKIEKKWEDYKKSNPISAPKKKVTNPEALETLAKRAGINPADVKEEHVGEDVYVYLYNDEPIGTYDLNRDSYVFPDDKPALVHPPEPPKPVERERDHTDSAYVSYGGVINFDHTTWDIDGDETTIEKTSDGRYYVQQGDFDLEFDTKGDLVNYLRSSDAEFAGEDSENDY